MSVDMDEVKAAAKLLVTDDEAVDLYNILATTVRRAALLPIKLTGKYTKMNPLLDLYRDDKETYSTILKWVVDKREDRNLPPLRDEKALNKSEYMREFMFDMRARWRKAVYIENMLRPEKDKLKGEPRRQFEKRCSLEWARQRDALLDAERKRLGVERLPQDVLQATLKAFWENVDEQLEEMEAMTIEELRRPIHQRHKLSPQMQALQRALESDE
jgi:hypothetical protein